VNSQDLSHDEWVALLPASFRQRRSVTLKFLSQQRFLMPGGGCEPYVCDLFREAKLELQTAISVKEMSTIRAMVAQRLGVSILPSLAVQGVDRGVRAVPLSPRQPRRFGQLLARDPVLSPALKAWSTIVHNAFPS
jgi:DNA-binding transcriptional LysR family regulator